MNIIADDKKKLIAYFAGAARDGSLDRKYFQIFSASKSWLENLQVILRNLNLRSNIYRLKNGYWKLKISKKRILPLLNFIEFRVPQINWETPSFLFGSSQEILRWYIGGFFDAEGSVSFSQKKFPNIEIYQANRKVLEDLGAFILELGIRPTKVIKKKDRNLFCIKITNKRGVEKFKSLIPILHPEKYKKLFLHTKAP